MRALAAALTVVAVFAVFALLILQHERQKKKLHDRMAYFSQAAHPEQALRQQAAKPSFKERFLASVRESATHVPDIRLTEYFDRLMEQADWPLLGREYLVVLILLAAVSAALATLMTLRASSTLLAAPCGALLGWAYLRLAIRRRRKAFVEQLGDMLTMVANALRAGFSFMQAFELIAREMDAPVGREVEKVISEINVGATLEQALENMTRRVQSPDFDLVVTAVLIQRQVGGNLAEILDTISETIQDRVRMRREVLALTAQGRLSGVILILLPIAIAAALTFINADALRPLYEEPMGRVAVVGAVVLEIIGYIVIRRIVDIDI
ncbi:type II secretion system F family protein [Selenomonas sp.]|jgi:tight adherence protein B|uniref:type II secretion system F family protein n=1 Tax=Selenomonas sp. TaxID=2053611 RepID=UPI003A0FDBB0